jgi:hypothetical protein
VNAACQETLSVSTMLTMSHLVMSNEPKKILNQMNTLFHGGKAIALVTARASNFREAD